MTRRKMSPFASAALAMMFFTASGGLGDEPAAAHKLSNSAAGDWNCRLGDHAIGTLFVRAQSYVLNRPGVAMAGEYQQDDNRVIVTNGPLRGFGVEDGTLVADEDARTLTFKAANGAVLACREVL